MEKITTQELRQRAAFVNREMNELCVAWKGQTWEEKHMHYTFEEYRRFLDGAGEKFKELALDRAAHDSGISLAQLKELAEFAYPES